MPDEPGPIGPVDGRLVPRFAGSSTFARLPEIDRVEWFDLAEAARRLKPAQVPFLERLRAALAEHDGTP